MRTADFKTDAPLKTYEIRATTRQLINYPGVDGAICYEIGERIEFVKTDDINQAMKGCRWDYEASEIGGTTQFRRFNEAQLNKFSKDLVSQAMAGNAAAATQEFHTAYPQVLGDEPEGYLTLRAQLIRIEQAARRDMDFVIRLIFNKEKDNG